MFISNSSEKNQTFWQLGCISAASLSIPGILVGGVIAQKYGVETAAVAILAGNLILWVLALAAVAMSADKQSNTIELVQEHFGMVGGSAALIFLVVSFLGWFVGQSQIFSQGVQNVVEIYMTTPEDFYIRIGTAFGFLAGVLSIWGIVVLKKLSVWAVPIIAFYILCAVTIAPLDISFSNLWAIPLAAIFMVTVPVLPWIIFLPSIFQFARTKQDAHLGLILMTLFSIAFQLGSIWMDFPNLEYFRTSNGLFPMVFAAFTLVFLALNLICTNLVNIYLGVTSWGRSVADGKAYAAFAILGTVLFAFSTYFPPMFFFKGLVNGALCNLATIMILSFLSRKVADPLRLVRLNFINNICWAAGCGVTLLVQMKYPEDIYSGLIGGITTSIVSFIFIFFVQEMILTIKKVR